MPATPIVEQITVNIVETLQEISEENGYDYTLTVERDKRRPPENYVDCHVIVFQLDPSLDPDNNLLQTQWIQPYALQVYIDIPSDENDTMIPSTRLNTITADIHKKLAEDITRGGLALDTTVLPWSEYLGGIGEHEGREVQFQVKYRTAWNDPYQLA